MNGNSTTAAAMAASISTKHALASPPEPPPTAAWCNISERRAQPSQRKNINSKCEAVNTTFLCQSIWSQNKINKHQSGHVALRDRRSDVTAKSSSIKNIHFLLKQQVSARPRGRVMKGCCNHSKENAYSCIS